MVCFEWVSERERGSGSQSAFSCSREPSGPTQHVPLNLGLVFYLFIFLIKCLDYSGVSSIGTIKSDSHSGIYQGSQGSATMSRTC